MIVWCVMEASRGLAVYIRSRAVVRARRRGGVRWSDGSEKWEMQHRTAGGDFRALRYLRVVSLSLRKFKKSILYHTIQAVVCLWTAQRFALPTDKIAPIYATEYMVRYSSSNDTPSLKVGYKSGFDLFNVQSGQTIKLRVASAYVWAVSGLALL